MSSLGTPHIESVSAPNTYKEAASPLWMNSDTSVKMRSCVPVTLMCSMSSGVSQSIDHPGISSFHLSPTNERPAARVALPVQCLLRPHLDSHPLPRLRLDVRDQSDVSVAPAVRLCSNLEDLEVRPDRSLDQHVLPQSQVPPVVPPPVQCPSVRACLAVSLALWGNSSPRLQSRVALRQLCGGNRLGVHCQPPLLLRSWWGADYRPSSGRDLMSSGNRWGRSSRSLSPPKNRHRKSI